MNNINDLYAESVYVEAMGMNSVQVTLNGVDLGDIVSNVGTTQLLEEMEVADVHEWVMEKLKEREEDMKYGV